jgi:hypothetical protein
MLCRPWAVLVHGGSRTGPRRRAHQSTCSWLIPATGAHHEVAKMKRGPWGFSFDPHRSLDSGEGARHWWWSFGFKRWRRELVWEPKEEN